MIKRIIFDIDGTLIPWKNEYWEKLSNVLKDYNLDTKENLDLLNDAYVYVEKNYEMYNKNIFLEIFSKYLNYDFDDIFYKKFIETIGSSAEIIEEDLLNTLDYLSNKYELAVFSNALSDVQLRRLEKLDIKKYFTDFYFGDTIKQKPNIDSFKTVCGKYKPGECLFIGDTLEFDYLPAKEAGLNAIIYNNSNKDFIEVKQISSYRELLEKL